MAMLKNQMVIIYDSLEKQSMLIKLCVLCPIIHLISNTPKWSQLYVQLSMPAWKNHHFSWENSLFLWPFSIAMSMLVITRGYIHHGFWMVLVLLVNEAAGINHRTWLTSYLLSCFCRAKDHRKHVTGICWDLMNLNP